METTNNAAKFAFFYLLSLVALTFTSIASGLVIFQIINKYVPDVLNQFSGNYSSETMRFGISALVIASPIYFLISRQLYKYLYSGEMAKDAVTRKWLTYFIMLVSSIVMIGWMISVLNNFLDGELSTKFMLKAITALGIAAAIFSFYLYDMKRDVVPGQKDKVISTFAYGALAFVSVVFVSSLFVVESPKEVRGQKLDNLIIEDFSQLQSAIDSYYADKKRLPESFDDLKKDYNFITDETIKDQETGRPYDYRKLEDKKYELCAVFRYSNKDDKNSYDYTRLNWPHEAGEQCISQKVSDLGAIPADKLNR